MGNVASRLGEEGTTIYLRDQPRFTVAALTITNSRNRTVLSITPNSFPATRYIPRRDIGDDTIVEYVQDPETAAPFATPSFLLRLPNDDELTFNFTFVMRQTQSPASFQSNAAQGAGQQATVDSAIKELTFIYAQSSREIDNLITREFHADPNIHKHPNVQRVGTYGTDGIPSVQFHWSWKWKPPTGTTEKGGGWRTSCSFVEYDQRAHRLEPLANFAFWVQNTPRPVSPKPVELSPRLEVGIPPRLRVPSNQSDISRLSEADGFESRDYAIQPPSPYTEAVGDEALTLVPTDTTTTASTTVKLDIAGTRRDEDAAYLDEGPLFRAKIKEFESKTLNMRQRWKKVLRKAEAALDAQSACNDAMHQLTEALKEASKSNANAVQPAIDHYFDKIAKEMAQYERENIKHLRGYIIDPVVRLYNVDIKQAESKKDDFDRDTKDWYQYMSRYLGQRQDSLKEKKRMETDAKHQNKRRTYELKRFDYSAYMQDLHGGRKDQEVLSSLTKYADAQTKGFLNTAKRIETMLPQLEALNFEVKEADKEYQLQRTEREEKRRALELSFTSNEPEMQSTPQGYSNMPMQSNGYRSGGESDANLRPMGNAPGSRMSLSAPTSAVAAMPNGPLPMRRSSQAMSSSGSSASQSLNVGSPNQNKFKGIRDLEEKDHSAPALDANGQHHRKEGLLWAMSRPGSHVDPKGLNKQAWHKFWIVLDQGRLSEYSNWKEKLDLHMEPIDLLMASVREARNAERRFCLEVVTPKFTRVYQAQSEEDMKSWITAINAALQTAWKRKGNAEPAFQTESFPASKTRDIAAVLTGKSPSVTYRSGPSSANNTKSVHRNATVGSDKPYTGSRIHDAGVEISTKLLEQVRAADDGNKYCADCGSEVDVEWASINLGIIVCIECSGIHRSLGTHITKMRSLTLDITSFTIDIVELLLSIGNRVSNMVWEQRLDQNLKPSPLATREQRLRFIKQKYEDRQWVQPISSTLSHYGTADETLLASIKRNDLQQVLYAIALGANRNAHDRSRNTHAVFLALAAADPAAPSSGTSPLPSPRGPHDAPISIPRKPLDVPSATTRKPFIIAELLLQNGADLPPQPAPILLSAQAKLYLEEKAQQREGRHSIKPVAAAGPNGDTLTALPTIMAGDGRSAGERARDRDRLAKRSSTGARVLMKAHGSTEEYAGRRGL